MISFLPMTYTYKHVAKMSGHSLLNPALTQDDPDAGIAIATKYDAYDLARAAEILKGTTIKASTTIGFPHCGHTTSIKVAEAAQALKDLTLMSKHSAAHVQVKAAGGIRGLDAQLKVREIGVTRIGVTRMAAMLDDACRRLGIPEVGGGTGSTTAAPAGYR